MQADKGTALFLLAVLMAVDAWAWHQVWYGRPSRAAAMSFLDVGQGDAILLTLPGGVRMLTDAGPDDAVLQALERTMPAGARYIDLALITHPETDHFNGFNHVIEAYRIGAFIVNGRTREPGGSRSWEELLRKAEERQVPLIALAAGDAIRHDRSRIDILSPDAQLLGGAELNDGALVQKVRTPEFSALLTADIGFSVEDLLRSRYDLVAEVLKIGHHGSKYSSSVNFLRAVRPRLAVVSSGERNTYGHPSPDALARFGAAGIPVLRTDRQGSITVRRVGGELRAFAGK